MASKLKQTAKAELQTAASPSITLPPSRQVSGAPATETHKDGNSPNGANGKTTIREDGKVGNKPRFVIKSKSVLNTKSDFGHKLLCDGMTFTAGHACAFSCSFCYVEALMRKNANLNALLEHRGLKHEDVVVEIENPVAALRHQLLLKNDKPRFNGSDGKKVIYASPLVDVAGSPAQVTVTIDLCREILKHTSWHIRLLSKSSLLVKVAEALKNDKKRMIYGFSTGTLDDNLTHSFEIGTASVSRRLKALKYLQDGGYRTFGMVCPIIPQQDYARFAEDLAKKMDIEKCEHVWAEVLNPRGTAMRDTSAAMRRKGFTAEADFVDKVAEDQAEWDKYAEQTFLALTKVIPSKKLRFLQYVDAGDYLVWEKHQSKGAVLLGKYAKTLNEVAGDDVALEVIKPLSSAEKARLSKAEARVLANTDAYVDVGLALREIREGKLYRETHSTFEAYCLARFDFGSNYGNRLMNAAEAIQKLKTVPIGTVLLPTSESQARELLKVDESKWPKVMQLAKKRAGDKKINALHIQLAAQEVVPPTEIESKQKADNVPKTYVTNEKIFLGWVETLKQLAIRDEKQELVRLLDKAAEDRAILPTMPEMIKFTDASLKYGWLNPMSNHPVEYKKQSYLTADVLFQCLRFEKNPKIQAELRAQTTALEVRMLVKKHLHLLESPDGESELPLMRQCLKLKMDQHPGLKDSLLATGSKLIVDDRTSSQKGAALFWGMAEINGQWVGDNWLGKLWMELRDKVKEVV